MDYNPPPPLTKLADALHVNLPAPDSRLPPQRDYTWMIPAATQFAGQVFDPKHIQKRIAEGYKPEPVKAMKKVRLLNGEIIEVPNDRQPAPTNEQGIALYQDVPDDDYQFRP